MWLKTVFVLAIASVVGACAGSLHQMPTVESEKLNLAQAEVQNGMAPQPRLVSEEEVQSTVQQAIELVRPAGAQLCHELRVGTCSWRFSLSRDSSINAGAAPGGIIQINRGVVAYADSVEEVAFVIGHEIGHHAANHLETSQRNQAVGATIGAIFMGAIAAMGTALRTRSPAARLRRLRRIVSATVSPTVWR